MPKKISAESAAYQNLLNTILSTLKFLLNWAGKKENFGDINVHAADIFGIILIYSVCLQEQ